MSPFANQPELWLTGHLRRLQQADEVVKIQAAARGFLARKQKLTQTSQGVVTPSTYNTLAEALTAFGLTEMTHSLPTAKQALDYPHMAEYRQSILWHAKVALRLASLSEYVMELEWADYRERNAALQSSDTPKPSLFDRLLKLVWE